jgi:hypothetical protein
MVFIDSSPTRISGAMCSRCSSRCSSLRQYRTPQSPKIARFCAQNFGANVLQMQLVEHLANEDGSLTQTGRTLDTLDQFFTLIFAFELALHMFAQWFRPFFNDGWNWSTSSQYSIAVT